MKAKTEMVPDKTTTTTTTKHQKFCFSPLLFQLMFKKTYKFLINILQKKSFDNNNRKTNQNKKTADNSTAMLS